MAAGVNVYTPKIDGGQFCKRRLHNCVSRARVDMGKHPTSVRTEIARPFYRFRFRDPLKSFVLMRTALARSLWVGKSC